jgi:hypothetical protein
MMNRITVVILLCEAIVTVSTPVLAEPSFRATVTPVAVEGGRVYPNAPPISPRSSPAPLVRLGAARETDAAELPKLALHIAEMIKPESPSLNKVSLILSADLTPKRFMNMLHSQNIQPRYFELGDGRDGSTSRGPGVFGKSSGIDRGKPIDEISTENVWETFMPGKNYAVELYKEGYVRERLMFQVTEKQGKGELRLRESEITLAPEYFRKIGFILDLSSTGLSPTDQKRIAESLGAKLEALHTALVWHSQVRSYDDFLALMQRPQYEEAPRYVIKITK